MKRLVNQLGTWPLTSPGLFQETLDLESVLVNLSLVNVGPLLEIGVYIDLKNSSLFIPTVRFQTGLQTYIYLLHSLGTVQTMLQTSIWLLHSIGTVFTMLQPCICLSHSLNTVRTCCRHNNTFTTFIGQVSDHNILKHNDTCIYYIHLVGITPYCRYNNTCIYCGSWVGFRLTIL